MLPLINLADSQGENKNMKCLSQMLSKELAAQEGGMNENQVFAFKNVLMYLALRIYKL